jgi:DNA-directed RNA polymerase subunit beta
LLVAGPCFRRTVGFGWKRASLRAEAFLDGVSCRPSGDMPFARNAHAARALRMTEVLDMHTASKNHYRDRVDFAKIPTSIPIPNLIDIQKKSYERFLQMRILSRDREDVGLQSVFKSVFPITDLRENCSLEFVEYSIGNWECKCGRLIGLDKLGRPCVYCGATLILDPRGDRELPCSKCERLNENRPSTCDTCDESVGLKLKYDVEECQERGMTFAVPLKVTIRLAVYDRDPETNVRMVRDIKEQEVYFGDIPLMTDNGTFIINGTERVIVSQLHRSPGVFFSQPEKGLFAAQIIPYRGSWLEFEYDSKNLLHVRIDRKRKFLATVFLRAMGMRSNSEILRSFYKHERIRIVDGKLYWRVSENLVGLKLSCSIHGPRDASGKREELLHAGKKITPAIVQQLQKLEVEEIEVGEGDLAGAIVLTDIIDTRTGEIMLETNESIAPEVLAAVLQPERQIEAFEVFFPERDDIGTMLSTTLKRDAIRSPEEALIEIYRRMRPGDPPTLESSRSLFDGMFRNPQKYDFSRVGRLKLNTKLGLSTPLSEKILSLEDVLAVMAFVLKLRRAPQEVDDIDHLGNRRVRSVGELLENQFRIGLVRMERAIKEKMSVYQEISTAMPHDLINAKPVMASIREFFGSSQLSQFMDQTNPLSEITHKRRLSALGPGGLSRERAGFEVRDVHPTHYGRICPIETPEGPNIGLISSLSCFARINEFGFIESPYRKVRNGHVVEYFQVVEAGDTTFKVGDVVEQDEVNRENAVARSRGKQSAGVEPYCFYLSAWEEDRHTIAQANVRIGDNGVIVEDRVSARRAGNSVLAKRDEIDYIDVSPKQLVSVAASLIPFLEHDDANRALMGSNMQRQAVPLLRSEAPLVGTGMEHITVKDSGAAVVCRRAGAVDSVDSRRVIVRVHGADEKTEIGADIYNLTKFKCSNQNTSINQKPIVRVGQRVDKGQILADGPCTDKGELALGRNVLVAFMPWRGFNFEDAILVSERLVKDDMYTSIHIEEFEIEARDTKLGPEEITRDIPNVSESLLNNLDESGIIRIGASVKPGDILVGKVTPKGETQLTPEEKLLRAIFGEKAGDVRDASLICPPGIEGIVVDVKIFSRKGVEKDERARQIEDAELFMMEKNLKDEIRILQDERDKRIEDLLDGKVVAGDLLNNRGEKVLKKGQVLSRETVRKLRHAEILMLRVQGKDDEDVVAQLDEIVDRTERQIDVLKTLFAEKEGRLKRGDELPPGVIKLVKVFVAMKRKLSVGDKMAGRHGNKGVIARILAEEDMPYLPDGTPVDIVLNPLGVPSRMNVGQILETHLGWCAFVLGMYFASPVFDGASEREVAHYLGLANEAERRRSSTRPNALEKGKVLLIDGMTGVPFEQRVTVGYIYMMKLSHLVDDKIHARSIGPYSLITQQPLGGKAQFGGQRFGEMEVWALEAYGAAHVLQELLTAKSDDVYGRAKIYEAIVKGDTVFTPGLPESFNVLIRELQSLGLDVELIKAGSRAARS